MANASSGSGDSSTFMNNNDKIKNLIIKFLEENDMMIANRASRIKEEEPEQTINEMIEDVEKELKNISALRSRYDIYHVPRQLYNQNPDAYRPHIVSIGPLHYHDDDHPLWIKQTYKLQYLDDLLKRSGKTFKFCVDALGGLDEDPRECYPETTNLGKVEFAKMMVMDSCFILQFLDSFYKARNIHHFVSQEPWCKHILIDLIKLENQLPLFVLRHLYGRLFAQDFSFSYFIFHSLIEPLTMEVNGSIPISVGVEEIEILIQADGGAKHFLDLFRRTLIPLSPRRTPSNESDSQLACKFTNGGALDLYICICIPFPRRKPSIEGDSKQIHNATELKSAGVKFQKKKDASNLFDIHFDMKKGVLTIPTIILFDDTEVVLRNLIASEQENLETTQYFTSYAAFMDNLIDTTKDVTLLTRKGIIINCLGSPEDAATLFNNIVKHVLIGDSYLSGVTKDLTEYYNKSWNKRMANLRQTYFNSPWAGISVVAAAFVIFLTMIQTICSLLQFKK